LHLQYIKHISLVVNFQESAGNLRLENKVAIVTGTANGIGSASACLFASEGASVAAVDIDGKANEVVVRRIRSLSGIVESFRADVAQNYEVRRTIDEVVTRFGRVDIIFNNAGIVPRSGRLHELNEAEWDRTMAVNVRSIYLLCSAVMPIFLKQRRGVILNTCSAAVFRTLAGRAAYAASKGAVLGLTKSMALDYARDGIRVNCLCPGTIDTPSLQERVALSVDPERERDLFVARQPMGRLGTAEEVATAALYLVSDEASFVTGAAFTIDGGMSI
jgi:meso-butanediol dehydrogenase / (S,S)-butanediol dehydrogenase / diacetyl reductase